MDGGIGLNVRTRLQQALVRLQHESPLMERDCILTVLPPGSDIGLFEDFVASQFRQRLQHHMFSDALQAIEARLSINVRSTHFLVFHRGEFAAALRATPSPFEWCQLGDFPQPSGTNLEQFVEFGRLIVHGENGMPLLGTGLMAAACEWAIQNDYDGIVAISRRAQKRLYERFGLSALSDQPTRVSSRDNGEYWLMTGGWEQILEAANSLTLKPVKDSGSQAGIFLASPPIDTLEHTP